MEDGKKAPAKPTKKKATPGKAKYIGVLLLLLLLAGGTGWMYNENQKLKKALEAARQQNKNNGIDPAAAPHAETVNDTTDKAPQDRTVASDDK